MNQFPQWNWVMCHTEHTYKFDGERGKDWFHKHEEFPVSFGKTIGYVVSFFDQIKTELTDTDTKSTGSNPDSSSEREMEAISMSVSPTFPLDLFLFSMLQWSFGGNILSRTNDGKDVKFGLRPGAAPIGQSGSNNNKKPAPNKKNTPNNKPKPKPAPKRKGGRK